MQSKQRYALGIDIGASSVKVAAAGAEPVHAAVDGAPAGPRLIWTARRPHHGDPIACLRDMLSALPGDLLVGACAGIAATGSGAGLLAEAGVDVPVLEDVPAIASGARLLAPGARSVIEIGGQNAYYACRLDAAVPEFSMNESCASGTGSFFEDQMTRLGLKIEDFSQLVAGAHEVPRISGRCAVFAKTDIIHRQQEGAPIEDILLGLCYAMVKSFKALIVRGLPVETPVALSGGVLLNAGVVRAVRDVLKLGEDELIADERNLFFQAAGAALHAVGAAGGGVTAATPQAVTQLVELLGRRRAAAELPRLAALPDGGYVAGPGFAAIPRERWPRDPQTGRTTATLGIDVGSTSTDLVLLDLDGNVLDAQYLRTGGDARRAVREGLASLGARLGRHIDVRAVATTGSGRGLIGKFVGADAVVDEITCQAAGAAYVDPLVDTVFEIGGQDSKFISLKDGQVADFQMNKVCAAGTGSFIEEQAARLAIPLPEYGPLALGSSAPVDLGERCTVFVETAISTALAAGASKRDVAAGLALSIVRNYLHRVVGAKPVGSHIVLQGGVAYNPAIVEAFRSFYPGALTVSPDFAVSGAVGAALMAAEAAAKPGFAQDGGTRFKGFDLSGGAGQAVQRAVDQAIERNRSFYRKTEELFLKDYTGQIDPAKKTVGIPLCLMLHRLFPLANKYFTQLGFNVLLSPNTTEEQVRLAQEHARGETCYPVKLIYGHMAWLAERGVDYIFMPSLHTIRHASSRVAHNYACPYMQTAPQLVAGALDLERRGIKLLNPVLDMDFGQQALAGALLGLGEELGHTRREAAMAMMAGGFAAEEFGRQTEALGDELLASLAPGERVLVLITRNYGLSDNVLNQGIPDILLDRGRKVITLGHLHGHDIDVSADHPGICWPFGQHILSGAKLVRRDPRLFAVYLTNHGCGPDTMIDKLFAEEMGDKPYLSIECDEHFSRVGVITRVEAFLNALDHLSEEDAVRLSTADGAADASGAHSSAEASVDMVSGPSRAHRGGTEDGDGVGADAGAGGCGLSSMALSLIPEDGDALVPEVPVAVPGVGAYGDLAAGWLSARGFKAHTVPLGAAALEAGRTATTTKEYSSFTAFLGAALVAAGVGTVAGGAGAVGPARAGSADGAGADAAAPAGPAPLSLALPATCGAEADNQYDRVIRTVLREHGRGDVRIASPRFETLPWALDRLLGQGAADELFGVLLAGDASYALPAVDRPGFVAACLERLAAEGPAALTDAWLASALVRPLAPRDASADAPLDTAGPVASPKRLSLVGEWPWVYADELAGDLWREAEGRGYRLRRMPLSEFFWMLWHDEYRHDVSQGSRLGTAGGVNAADPFVGSDGELARRATVLKALRGRMAALSDAIDRVFGEGVSPFEADLDALGAVADVELGPFRGAGARYRVAKAARERLRSNGVVTVASMYENVDTILRLKGDLEESASVGAGGAAPILRLSFDGALDASNLDKLRSYLYYV